jgi:succinate-semialdehyde dehydrogenase/glutarate-semialdehyde dehydrogenase
VQVFERGLDAAGLQGHHGFRMIETGRLGVINPARETPQFTPELLERLARRVALWGPGTPHTLYSPFDGKILGVEDVRQAV